MTTEDTRLPSPGRIQIFTDGGCKPNPGPGGWGAVVRFVDHQGIEQEWQLSGNHPATTNNQMELQAALASLAALHGHFGRCQIDLHTDSQYLRRGITQWVDKWERNGWQTAQDEAVKNKELWLALQYLIGQHDVEWHWLKGHAGHAHNERADQLATRARSALGRARPDPAAPQPEEPAEVNIYIKASYNGRLNVGGWGVVLRRGEHSREISRREVDSSANALLVRGAAEGLWALNRPCAVIVFSDADYLIRGASQWIKGWLARGWQTKDGKPVANRAEWEALLAAMQPHRVRWQLEQPADSPPLERAGELAVAAAQDDKAAG